MKVQNQQITASKLEELLFRKNLPNTDQLAKNLEEGFGLPAHFYDDPEIAALENEMIFNKTWQYACHISQLQKAGDYVVTNAGKTPIMIVKQRDGQLRAFVNACRHRLHSLAKENGSAKLFQCPYHGWTYDLDGQLRNAPRADREPNFDCAKIALIPVAVEQWHQWVYVNPDPDADSLASQVAPVEQMAHEMNTDLSQYEYQSRLEYEMDCNWKLWAENAVECYHCPTMHQYSFGQAYDVSPDAYHIGADGINIWNTGPVEWTPKGIDLTNSKGFRFLFQFPSSFFALDDLVGFVGAVYPTSPTTSYAFIDLYAKPGADPETVAAYEKMWDQTLIEDKQASDAQQAGYSSRQIEKAHLLLDSELTIQAFLQNVLEKMRG